MSKNYSVSQFPLYERPDQFSAEYAFGQEKRELFIDVEELVGLFPSGSVIELWGGNIREADEWLSFHIEPDCIYIEHPNRCTYKIPPNAILIFMMSEHGKRVELNIVNPYGDGIIDVGASGRIAWARRHDVAVSNYQESAFIYDHSIALPMLQKYNISAVTITDLKKSIDLISASNIHDFINSFSRTDII